MNCTNQIHQHESFRTSEVNDNHTSCIFTRCTLALDESLNALGFTHDAIQLVNGSTLDHCIIQGTGDPNIAALRIRTDQ